jgi:hypothetical protein
MLITIKKVRRNWGLKKTNPKQKHGLTSRIDAEQEKKIKLIEGYNLINGVKLWYQMICTSWSCGQATHNEDETTPRKPRNQVW